jgi:hypothetical protein
MPSIFITPAGVAGGPLITSNLDIVASTISNYRGSVTIGRNIGSPDYGQALTGNTTALIVYPNGIITNGNQLFIQAVAMTGTITQGNISGSFPIKNLFVDSTTSIFQSPAITAMGGAVSFFVNANIRNDFATATTSGTYTGYSCNVALSSPTAGGTLTTTAINYVQGSIAVNSGATLTDHRGLLFADATGAGTVTNQVAVDIVALSKGSTLNIGVRSTTIAGANNYFLRDTGGAKSEFKGLFTRYNDLPLGGFGVPAIVSLNRLTGQTAAIALLINYTPTVDATFLVSYNVKITTLGSGSFTVGCTHTDEASLSRATTMAYFATNGTLATTTNTTTSSTGIPFQIRAKAATSIVVSTQGTFTGCTYNVEAQLIQIS